MCRFLQIMTVNTGLYRQSRTRASFQHNVPEIFDFTLRRKQSAALAAVVWGVQGQYRTDWYVISSIFLYEPNKMFFWQTHHVSVHSGCRHLHWNVLLCRLSLLLICRQKTTSDLWMKVYVGSYTRSTDVCSKASCMCNCPNNIFPQEKIQ